MYPKKLYSFLAGVSNFYFLSFLLGAVIALVMTLFETTVGMGVLLMPILCLIVVILYHLQFAKRVPWRSPGELLVGQVLKEGVKEWTNPYGRNRWALFTVLLFTVVIASNTWDKLGEGKIYSLTEISARTVLVATLYFALVRIGMGKLKFALIPIAFSIFMLFVSLTNIKTIDVQFSNFMVIFSIVSILAYVTVSIAYHFLRGVKSE